MNAIKATSGLEWLAVCTGIAYVVLVMFKHNSAWIFAFISSFIYVYISYISKLYIDSFLQLFYVVMAIYGWISWQFKAKSAENDTSFVVVVWPKSYHFLNFLISCPLACLIGYLFSNYTEQANPYTDAFVTVFSLVATYMVVQKVLENWIYWVIIDAGCVYLFASRSLYMTAVLYAIFCLLAINGYWVWHKLYRGLRIKTE
jgi:nicotinamide mononucleotide transporter